MRILKKKSSFFMKEISLEKKLYVPRDIGGEPVPEVFEVVRQLEEKLQKYPRFVGIALLGSSVGGYGTESSDIDLRILYDPRYLEREKNMSETLWNVVVAVCREREKENKKHISPELVSLDPERDMNSFKQWGSDDMARAVANTARVMSGEKIGDYRKRYREVLHTLSSSSQQKIIEEALKILSDEDLSRLHTRAWRTAELEKKDVKETYVEQEKILVARQKLWRNRIQKFFG